MRGQLSQNAYDAEVALVRETLSGYTKNNPELPHWPDFLAAWK
jgi:putative N-acetylmannosamine-6-phosphate epimerase